MDNEIAIIDDVNSMTNVTEPIKVTGLGTRLKTAREAMHLSQKEAAERLYLSVKIISLIENENFSDGPPMTFLRGYLRAYAKLLNIPESEIKAELDEIDLTIPPVNIASPILHATPINRSEKYIRWITYLIILTLITLVCIWWSSQSHYLIADMPGKTTPFQAPPVTVMKAPPPTKTLPQTTVIEKPEFSHHPQPAMGIMIPTQHGTVSMSGATTMTPVAPLSTESNNGNSRQRESKQTETPAPGATLPESG
ncbi:MAG TPA: helix-turn-helix domain-containing protein [Gammaproteobacteria bacterium]|jgi:cytoskeleton protein RodZ|nr:helix-turn-helix domain-containing protein [Gammaproteobacteria bacterium]